MSNPSRCPDCNHRRGPRSTGNTTAAGVPKKHECSCDCHQTVQAIPLVAFDLGIDASIEDVLIGIRDRIRSQERG